MEDVFRKGLRAFYNKADHAETDNRLQQLLVRSKRSSSLVGM